MTLRYVSGHLKERKRHNLRLTGISNPYLSQLERGHAKTPNPNLLYELARIYGVNYNHLMMLAGYPVMEAKTASDNQVAAERANLEHFGKQWQHLKK